jgi:hypothetical protein
MRSVRLTMTILSGSLLVAVSPGWAQAPDSPAPPPSAASPPPAAQGAPVAPPPAAPGAPPNVPAPGSPAYPPYAYPPPYGYPPGYAYPPPGYPAYPPGYPPYPAAYPPYPAYAPPPSPEPPPEPPTPLPAGKWRLGATLLLIPKNQDFSYLSYDLRVRDESLLTHEGGIKSTAGVSVFAEVDLIRYVHLALAVQFLPWVEWVSAATATRADPFVGTAQEVDFFPQLGVTFPATRRLRILGYVAPGYSLFAASDMADIFANSGTPHGFALQLGGGILYAIGQSAFFTVRASEQWAFYGNQVRSNTTGETADVSFRLRFLALHNSVGFWF